MQEEEDEHRAWTEAAVWGPKGPQLQGQEVQKAKSAQRNLLNVYLQGAEAGESRELARRERVERTGREPREGAGLRVGTPFSLALRRVASCPSRGGRT